MGPLAAGLVVAGIVVAPVVVLWAYVELDVWRRRRRACRHAARRHGVVDLEGRRRVGRPW